MDRQVNVAGQVDARWDHSAPAGLIIMNGPTASLKTTTARRLSTLLGILLVETNKFGRCTDDQQLLSNSLRDARYVKALAVADAALGVGHPVIVDGTFAQRKWRQQAYAIASRRGVSDIVIVRCVCEDEQIIRLRMRDRSSHPYAPDNEASFRFENYLTTRREEESVWEDVVGPALPAVVEFNTATYEVAMARHGGSSLAPAIYCAIWESVHSGALSGRL